MAGTSRSLRGDGDVYVDSVKCTGDKPLPMEPVAWPTFPVHGYHWVVGG